MKRILSKVYMFPSFLWNKINLLLHGAEIGSGCVIRGRLRLYGKGKLEMSKNVKINSMYRLNPIGGNQFSSFYIKNGAEIKIGKGSGMSNVALYAAKRIEIGENCKLGGGVSIYDTDFHSSDYKERAMVDDPGIKTIPVKIGNDVFVGAHSIILKGVTIGDRSVIGAGSVVTKNVPEDEIWAGVPAVCIRKNK